MAWIDQLRKIMNSLVSQITIKIQHILEGSQLIAKRYDYLGTATWLWRDHKLQAGDDVTCQFGASSLSSMSTDHACQPLVSS